MDVRVCQHWVADRSLKGGVWSKGRLLKECGWPNLQPSVVEVSKMTEIAYIILNSSLFNGTTKSSSG